MFLENLLNFPTFGSDNTFVFEAPTVENDTTNGIELTNSLDVTGRSNGRFTVNANNKICDTNHGSCSGLGSCSTEAPVFSFTKN